VFNLGVYAGLLSTLVRLSNNRRRYYIAMKHKLIEIVIQRPILNSELVKSRSLLILLNIINAEKNSYFRAVFIVIERDLAYFRRRIRVLLKRRLIKQRFYLLLTVR
jgi:hypothetical protein